MNVHYDARERSTFMAKDRPLQVIDRDSQAYPILLTKRLGKDAPVRLWAIGRLDLISIPKTALFCSKICRIRVIVFDSI